MVLDRNKAVLGFSGGVDSSVACWLLKEKGMEVHALYFDVSENGNTEEIKSAELAAEKLEVPLTVVNVHARFKENVIEPFCRTYADGKTPNPCVLCNHVHKFPVIKEFADSIGAYYIATGHYAVIEEYHNNYYVNMSPNIAKDQSYMLCRLKRDVLSRLILPLGEYSSKDEIRSIARDLGLPNAHSKDSQDICFIPDGDHSAYISSQGYKGKDGCFVNDNGEKIAAHKGTLNYTIGQRKGLGIALGSPAFVSSIDIDTGNVCVTTDESRLFKHEVLINNVYIQDPEIKEGSVVNAKLRYTRSSSECTVSFKGDKAILLFKEPQRAPAPGQEAVLYKNNRLVGCGTIL